MSGLVGNPEDRFSHNEAHMVVVGRPALHWNDPLNSLMEIIK